MTQPAKAQEPSMEEILASIRRIIADDDASKSPVRSAEPTKAEPAPPPPSAPPLYSAPPVTVPRPRFEADPFSMAEEPSSMGDEAVADQSSDILDLTESMAAPMPQSSSSAPSPAPSAASHSAPQFRTIDGSSDVGFDEGSESLAASVARYGGDDRGRLISSEASAAVDSAFNALAQTVLVQNARTLEDLVREMLRPMLKTWLDDNLPGMVERLVRAEIERVSRGRAS
jgi:cell pole-organizing protein PopZ